MLSSSWPTHEPSSRDPTTTTTTTTAANSARLGEKRRRKTSRHGLDDCFAVLRMAGRQFGRGLFPSAPEPSRAHLYHYDPVSLFGDSDPADAKSSCGHERDCAADAADDDEGVARPPSTAVAAKPAPPAAAAAAVARRTSLKTDFFSSSTMSLNLIGTDDMACFSARDDEAPGLATLRRRSGVAGLRDQPLAVTAATPATTPSRRRHSSVMNVSYRWNITEADAIEIMMAVEAANSGAESNQ